MDAKIFIEDFNFISKSFSLCEWPKPVESDDSGDSTDEDGNEPTIEDDNLKMMKMVNEGSKIKSSRAGTIEELLKKQEQLKSKESRKRKKEQREKTKKKKKKKTSNDSTTIPSDKQEEDSVEVVIDNTISGEKNEDKKEKIAKITRAPIKHGADVVVNKDGCMLFSKIAFSDSVNELKPKLGGPKQPKHVLGKLDKMNSLISSLEERGKKEKAQRLKENISWSNAFFKVEGAKIKDNTNKVQKSVKQLEKRKRISERKWKKRLEDIESKKEKKQKKRETHIRKRVDQKKERKLKKLIRRGRFIPELKTK